MGLFRVQVHAKSHDPLSNWGSGVRQATSLPALSTPMPRGAFAKHEVVGGLTRSIGFRV